MVVDVMGKDATGCTRMREVMDVRFTPLETVR